MQKLKGLWIPAEILLDEKLSDKEKIILSMIVYLSEENKCCFASNKYFASIVNVTTNRISKIISSLNTKEYINIKLKFKTDSKEIEERQIIPIVKNIKRYCQNQQEGIGENNYSSSSKQQYPIGKNDKDIIYNIKNKNNYNNTNKSSNKKYSNFEQRNYNNFDWSSLYANLKEVNSNLN